MTQISLTAAHRRATTRPAQNVSGVGGVIGWLIRLDAGYREGRRLHRLSDAHLRDMGLRRVAGRIARIGE